LNSSWFKTICLFIPGFGISFLIYVYFPTLSRSGILFPFEFNFLLWFLLLLAHKDQIAYKHQRKIAAFIGLNFNLYVFLIHAIEGIKIEREGEWENYTQIIFEPMWTIKRELVWLPMSGYIFFMVFYAAIYLYLRHRESIKN
jgi:hypothetical protein